MTFLNDNFVSQITDSQRPIKIKSRFGPNDEKMNILSRLKKYYNYN